MPCSAGVEYLRDRVELFAFNTTLHSVYFVLAI